MLSAKELFDLNKSPPREIDLNQSPSTNDESIVVNTDPTSQIGSVTQHPNHLATVQTLSPKTNPAQDQTSKKSSSNPKTRKRQSEWVKMIYVRKKQGTMTDSDLKYLNTRIKINKKYYARNMAKLQESRTRKYKEKKEKKNK